jgi:hypothetical protein
MLNWDLTPDDADLVHTIAVRAVSIATKEGIDYSLQDAEMDITAAHLNGCPLRLQDLAIARLGEFGHDVFGIRRHLNRDTGKLRDHFHPRYAR